MQEYLNELICFGNFVSNKIFFRKVQFEYTDGGRKKANIKGKEDQDCVSRAIATAFDMDYKKVYDTLYNMQKKHYKKIGGDVTSPKPIYGVELEIYEKFLATKGLEFTYNKLKLAELNLKKGKYICLEEINESTGHTFVIDKGVLYDNNSRSIDRGIIVGYIKLEEVA